MTTGGPAGAALRDREGAAEAAETASDSNDQEECMLTRCTMLLVEYHDLPLGRAPALYYHHALATYRELVPRRYHSSREMLASSPHTVHRGRNMGAECPWLKENYDDEAGLCGVKCGMKP